MQYIFQYQTLYIEPEQSNMKMSEYRGHGGRVATLSPPISEIWVRFPARPQVGKMVVACRWSAVYSTEP